MKAYTYIDKGHFALLEKPEPRILDPKDAIVKVTLASICTSDLHIKHGSVPRAVPGITVGHEMVGIVTEVGDQVHSVKPGDRVTVNVETYCGECWFCKHGYVNNCQSPDTTTLITHRYSLENFEEAYRVFENREDGVIKVAVDCLRPVVI